MPFQSEKQRRYLHANHPDIAQRWEQEYAGGGVARKEFLTGGFPDFFQMTPENMATARSTPWSTALNQDFNPWGKDYRGFNTSYRGADKAGLGKYVSGGLKSLAGVYEPGSNIGGATNLMRKMALGTSKHLPKLLSKAALPFELLRASPVNADEAEMDIEDFQTLNKSMGTNINELPPIFDAFQNARDLGFDQFFRNQPVDEYVPWHQQGTLKDVFQAGDFPLKDNFAKTKVAVSDLVEGGIDKTRAGGKWLKDLALTAGGAIADIPLGLLNLFQGQFQNTPEEDAMVDLYGGNTIRSGPMAGYNTASMYGRGIIDATQRRLDRRAQVKTDKWNQKKKERWDRANQALEQELARQKEAKEKAEREKQAAFQRQLDQAYQQHGGGGDSPSGGGGRYDGASSKQEWSRDPTGYSGSFAHGGLAGLWPKR
tara:strand:- start:140 stop:1420 length:1281 start_codon:yes stop_codon:yes gene_type:complete